MGGWTITVDGLVLPKPVSGRPALELCNTRAAWDRAYDPAHDYLRSYAHLVVLAREHGLAAPDRAAELVDRTRRAGGDTVAMREELERARRLRADARAVLLGAAPDTAFRRVADAAGAARGRQRLSRHTSGVAWTWPGRPQVSEPLDAMLLAVAELLVAEGHRHVRACPGLGCGWLFIDRTGRRRWCQMAVCGNRAKQARIRRS